MARRERVVLADEAADHPSPVGTTAFALLALTAGFASAYALRADDPQSAGAERAAEPASPPRELPPATDAVEDRAGTVALAAPPPNDPQPVASIAPPAPEPEAAIAHEAQPAPEPEPVPEPDPIPEPEPAAAPEPAPAPRRVRAAAAPPAADDVAGEPQRLKPGIVAYLRCDGVPQVAGPFPCPRDVPFERRVWRALRWLENCPALEGAQGAGEVRLELTQGGTQVHVVSGELDRKAVRQCAAGLSSARTALHPDRMIVAFRFDLH